MAADSGKFLPDMAQMEDLGPASITENLAKMYLIVPQAGDDAPAKRSTAAIKRVHHHSAPGLDVKNPVYAQAGTVLVSINPHKSMPYYTDAWVEAFRELGRTGEMEHSLKILGPHCFAVAEKAYQGIKNRSTPHQCIIPMGQSGSGKSFVLGKMYSYLASTSCENVELQQKIQAARELLRLFAHAKTMCCEEATRFTSHYKLFFDGEENNMVACRIAQFGMECDRFSSTPVKEGNFLVVHALAAEAAAMEDRRFGFVPGEPDTDYQGVDRTNAAKLKSLLLQAGFTEEERDRYVNFVLGLLYWGDLKFVGKEVALNNEKIKLPNGGSIDPDKDKGPGSDIDKDSMTDFAKVCELLDIDKKYIHRCMTRRPDPVSPGAKYWCMRAIRPELAVAQSRHITKQLYAMLIRLLIEQLNAKMGDTEEKMRTISFIDHPGFADRRFNYFDQLLINTSHEYMESYFAQMLEREKGEFLEEGIDFGDLYPMDTEHPANINKLLTNYGGNPGGILKQYDDQSGRNADVRKFLETSLCGKVSLGQWKQPKVLETVFGKISSPKDLSVYAKAKYERLKKYTDDDEWTEKSLTGIQNFVVKHALGDVIYSVQDFWESGPSEPFTKQEEFRIVELLQKSKNPLMTQMFANYNYEAQIKDKRKKAKVLIDELGSLFKNVIEPSRCWFVRCISPNTANHKSSLEREEVARQLPQSGLPTALALSKAEMPERLLFTEFVNEFWALERWGNMKNYLDRDTTIPPPNRCKELLQMYLTDEVPPLWKIGKTKVFMKRGILDMLRGFRQVMFTRAACLTRRMFRFRQGVDFLMVVITYDDRLEDIIAKNEEWSVNNEPEIKEAMAKADQEMRKAIFDQPKFKQVKEAYMVSYDKGVLPKDPKSFGVSPEAVAHEGFWDFISQTERTCNDFVNTIEEGRQKQREIIDAAVAARKEVFNGKSNEINGIRDRVFKKKNEDEIVISANCATAMEKMEALNSALEAACHKAMDTVAQTVDKNPTPWVIPKDVDNQQAEVWAYIQTECADVLARLEEKKRRFRETLENNPEFVSLIKNTAEAKERLDQVADSESVKGEMEAWDKVASQMTNAWDLWHDIEAQLEEGVNSEMYATYMRWFLESEAQVQAAVAEVDRLEAERLERELAAVREFYLSFDKQKELSELHRHFMDRLINLTGFVQAIEPGPSSGVDELSRNEYLNLLEQVRTDVRSLHMEVMTNETVGHGLRYTYFGAWSVERFKLLGTNLRGYTTLGKVLDETKYTSISDAVEALNQGTITVESGYCIGWSAVWDRYYLLYDEKSQEKAFRALDRTKAQQALKEKNEKLSAVKKAIGGAVQSLSRKSAEDRLTNERQELENRIRDEVSAELADRYANDALQEFEAKAEVLLREGADEVAKRKTQREQALESTQTEAVEYNDKIADLLKKLRHCEIRTGSKGSFPAAYAQLVDVWTELTELRSKTQVLVDHTSASIDDLQVSLTYGRGMVDEETMALKLRDLVVVLTHCQQRQTEIEKIAVDLAVEGLYPKMKQVRSKMVAVAKDLKVVCEKQAAGTLEKPERDSLCNNIQYCETGYRELLALCYDWHLRMDNALHYIEQCLEHTDIKVAIINEMKGERLHQPTTERGAGGFLDVMYSGIMQNFCAAGNRPGSTTTAPATNVRLFGAQQAQAAANKTQAPKVLSEGSAKGQLLQGQKNQFSKPTSPVKKVDYGIQVGDRCVDLATRSNYGTIRYLGPTNIAAGEWAGIELDEPKGKTDGTINGTTYFRCDRKHGTFLRPSLIDKILPGRPGSTPGTGRPPSASASSRNGAGGGVAYY